MTTLELQSLVFQFENCTLPRESWTHQAHLSVALWYLFHLPREQATGRIRNGIQLYNESLGIGTGYHETMTLAWIEILAGFLQESSAEGNLAELVERATVRFGISDYLLQFFSRDRLFSELARREWVEPDLARLTIE